MLRWLSWGGFDELAGSFEGVVVEYWSRDIGSFFGAYVAFEGRFGREEGSIQVSLPTRTFSCRGFEMTILLERRRRRRERERRQGKAGLTVLAIAELLASSRRAI